MKRQHRAIVEKYRPTRVGDIMTRERAKLPCGCAMYVGRTGTQEAATRTQACQEDHTIVVERANALLVEEQTHPTVGRPLSAVCSAVLSQAARELI